MSATPPGTPKPASKWASRMGAAVRRSSTLLSIARPATPQTDRDSDTNSLRKSISREAIATPPRVDTSSPAPTATSPPQAQVMIPTPIAESPAREAEAIREAAGPSLLSQGVVVADDKPKDEYVPPPTIDYTAGNPGAFTDIIDTIPQPSVVKDPFAATNTGPPPPPAVEPEPEAALAPAPANSEAPPPEPTNQTEDAAPVPNLVDSAAGNPGAFTDEPEQLPQPTIARDVYADPVEDPAPESDPAPAPAEATKPEPETIPDPEPSPKLEAPALTPTISYFDDKPMAESMSGSPTEAISPDFAAAVEANVPVRSSTPEPGPAPEPLDEVIAMPIPAVTAVEAIGTNSDAGVHGEPASEPISMPVPDVGASPEVSREANGAAQNGTHGVFGAAVIPPYALGEYSSPDIWGGAEHVQKSENENVWATRDADPAAEETEEERYTGYTTALPIAVPIPVRASESMEHRGHSVESMPLMPNPHPDNEDPFADPPEAVPVPQVMPRNDEDAHHIVTMPLPSFDDVVLPQPIDQAASRSNIAMPTAEANERTSLIPGSHKSYTKHHHHHPHILNAPTASTSWPPHGAAAPQFTELGWLAYILPDASTYYAHPGRRTTTAADLRSPRVLSAVEAWLNARGDEARDVGVEAWLRASVAPGKGRSGWGKKKGAEDEVLIERFWVDHHVRTVVRDMQEARGVGFVRGHIRGHGSHKGKSVTGEQEEQLDLEFRYWSFMDAHPAHNPLPHTAKAEAMDVLTWAWTDRLLPSARPIPAPFAQEECQELMSLLRSFNNDDSRDDHGIQTRVVARILLRVALWRQTYFRPQKPLPSDAGVALHSLTPPRRPFFRALFDIVVSILCLGIPLLFIERARLSGTRADQESGFVRSNPLIVTGACTCLVAAVVLSSSVTFVSLPGLDNAARTAGMVAVVFAAFAIFATSAAVLRHKTELGRPAARVGVEGLMAISRRTVALSLPAVFVAYSLVAFVTGIVLYTFRGVPDPRGPERSFGDYMRWVVVGVAGALAGIVTMALIVLRA